jgi:hypothetical protein
MVGALEDGLGAQKSDCRRAYEKIRKSRLSQIPIRKGSIRRRGHTPNGPTIERIYIFIFLYDCGLELTVVLVVLETNSLGIQFILIVELVENWCIRKNQNCYGLLWTAMDC